ncbi:MAG: carbamoyltransferase [Gammaproteobacteria bacterium]|nr:carbamoyltransferase [Gammaproteobacteria bacterium]
MIDPWILGYSATHNGAVCLLQGDEIVAAVQEERLTGIKRARLGRLDESLAFRYCLDAGGIEAKDLDIIVGAYFSGDPVVGTNVAEEGRPRQLITIPHHFAHAAGVFAMSGFQESAVLVIDGQGGLADALPASEMINVKRSTVPDLRRWAETITIYVANGREIRCVEKHLGEWMPDMKNLRRGQPMQTFGSIGGMYSSVSHQIFGDAMDAGKVMGLAAFGNCSYPTEDFFTINEDGHFSFSDKIPKRYSNVAHWPENQSENQNLATSVQHALEDAIFYLVEHTRELTSSPNLCYAGGVALNAITNEQIIQRCYFDDVYIMAAAEDSGTAIGAAYYGLWQLGKVHRQVRHNNDCVGRVYQTKEIDRAISKTPCVEVVATEDPVQTVVEFLEQGKIIGWFSGGSEIGPRALGQRSILSDARSEGAKTRLNARVKHRETFRPFAPLVLEEETANWFDTPAIAPSSPLMLRTFPFRKDVKNLVPAVVHEDGTGRLQTINAKDYPGLHDLLIRFYARTGVPIIVNTSFNVMGEPIVETPEDALWCLLYTDLDYCFLEDRLVKRSAAFRSMLDLYPCVTTIRYRVDASIVDNPKEVEVTPQSTIMLDVETPWGIASQFLPQIALPILRLADSQHTARQILDSVQTTTLLDEATFKNIIRHLRRAHVLKFSDKPG